MELISTTNWLKIIFLLLVSQLFLFWGGIASYAAELSSTNNVVIEEKNRAEETSESPENLSPTEAVESIFDSANQALPTNEVNELEKIVEENPSEEVDNQQSDPLVVDNQNQEHQSKDQEIVPNKDSLEAENAELTEESIGTLGTSQTTNETDKEVNQPDKTARPEKVTESIKSKENFEPSVESQPTNKELEELGISPEIMKNILTLQQSRILSVTNRAITPSVVHSQLVSASNGLNWASVILPNGLSFTYNMIEIFDADGNVAFCVEPGVPGSAGAFTPSTLETYFKDPNIRQKITLISYFGYVNNPDKSLEQRIATQFLIHEQLNSIPYGTNPILEYDRRKAEIMSLVNNFDSKASFHNRTETVKVGETIKVTDTNSFLSKVKNIVTPIGIAATIKGNDLFITATKDAPEKAQIGLDQIKVTSAPIVYKKPGFQTVAVLNPTEPGRSVLNLNILKQGNLAIQKIDADTKKPLVHAQIDVMINGVKQTITTDATGKGQINGLLHGTKVMAHEVLAPNGYVLNATPQTITIEANQTVTLTFTNKEQLGNAILIKEDKDTGSLSQGKAALENAVYGLYQADGKKIKSVTLKNRNGHVQAEVKDLKLGSYWWQEEIAPIGYVLNPTKLFFDLVYGKQTETHVTSMTIAKDQVILGNVEGYKFGNKELVPTLPNKEVKVPLEAIELTATSKTTGKAYVTTTDALGHYLLRDLPYDDYHLTETKGHEGYQLFTPFDFSITAHGQVLHYLLEDPIIEQQLKIVKVDAETGEVIALPATTFKIFDTLANQYVTMPIPNDTEVTDLFQTNAKGYLVTNGALAYGINRYRLEEVNAPTNYVLNKTPFIFSVTDNVEPIQVIQFGDPKARKQVKVFKYEEFNNVKTPLEGVHFTLYQADGLVIGHYVTNAAGELVVKELLANDYYFLEDAPLESFQPNRDRHGFTVAFQPNAPDNGETLGIMIQNVLIPPTLATQATNQADGLSIVDPLEQVVIKDVVHFTDLFVGKEYTMAGILMNQRTNAPILENEQPITSQLTFMADQANGTKDLEFVVNASVLKGETIVVFETLFRDGMEVALHADIMEEHQSIKVNHPTLHTTAFFEDGLKLADPTGLFTLNDTVEIEEILAGKTYLVKGILMDKATNDVLFVHGHPVETTVGFIARDHHATVVVPFTFDLRGLNDREIVVFETLIRDGEELGNHQVIEDEGQTVCVTNPTIRTTATHKTTGLKQVNPLKKVTIMDAVAYQDLIIGKEYTVQGILMNQTTGEVLMIQGQPVTTTLIFVAESTKGTVNLDFVIDARELAGQSVVVFEELWRQGVILASHAELTDLAQTIEVVKPRIQTKATTPNGGKDMLALPNQRVNEWVQLNGLAIGQTYQLIVQGYLTPEGTVMPGTHTEKIFIADQKTMAFLFEFLVDGRLLAGKGLSFAEWLNAKTEEEQATFEEVAQHNVDLQSEDQTVHFVAVPKTPETPETSQLTLPDQAPILPQTGEATTHTLFTLGVILLALAAGVMVSVYKLRQIKE